MLILNYFSCTVFGAGIKVQFRVYDQASGKGLRRVSSTIISTGTCHRCQIRRSVIHSHIPESEKKKPPYPHRYIANNLFLSYRIFLIFFANMLFLGKLDPEHFGRVRFGSGKNRSGSRSKTEYYFFNTNFYIKVAQFVFDCIHTLFA